MKTITIQGSFTVKSANQSVSVEVYATNSSGEIYDFKKNYPDDFTLTLDDLASNQDYFIDFTGGTIGGSFSITISGDFIPPNPISDNFQNTLFTPGYAITTTP